jgi:porphobilinogen synthase
MHFPDYRPRRLRKNKHIREMVCETRLSVDDFVYPMFIAPGRRFKEEITSMPGIFSQSIDNAIREIKLAKELGIKAILLFGIPEVKDELGSEAYDENGIIQRALREIRKRVDNIVLFTDVCMCAYTTHGHCGIIRDGKVDNDE